MQAYEARQKLIPNLPLEIPAARYRIGAARMTDVGRSVMPDDDRRKDNVGRALNDSKIFAAIS